MVLTLGSLLNDSPTKRVSKAKEKVQGKISVQAPRDEFIGAYSTMCVSSPPEVAPNKKASREKRNLGYGIVEPAPVFDDCGLSSLFASTYAKTVEHAKGVGNHKKVKPKEVRNIFHHLSPHSTILVPLRYEDGAMEYQIVSNGSPKPFVKARAILPSELKEKGVRGIREVMGKVISFVFKEPPWSARTLSSRH